LHLRLVAPLDYRLATIARQLNLSAHDAAAHIHQIEHNRRAFYHRHWPSETLDPEHFAVTINTAHVSMPAIIQMVHAMVHELAVR
jgi:cytidylate kinase